MNQKEVSEKLAKSKNIIGKVFLKNKILEKVIDVVPVELPNNEFKILVKTEAKIEGEYDIDWFLEEYKEFKD